MKISILDTCDCGCNERVFFSLKTTPLQIRWFMDAGYWFLYFHIFKNYWRFSNAGYLSGKSK